MKEDFAFNFEVVTKQDGADEYQQAVLTDYDCEFDYLPDLLADKDGWKNFNDFFPYDGQIKTPAAKVTCEFMGWEPEWLAA